MEPLSEKRPGLDPPTSAGPSEEAPAIESRSTESTATEWPSDLDCLSRGRWPGAPRTRHPSPDPLQGGTRAVGEQLSAVRRRDHGDGLPSSPHEGHW